MTVVFMNGNVYIRKEDGFLVIVILRAPLAAETISQNVFLYIYSTRGTS